MITQNFINVMRAMLASARTDYTYNIPITRRDGSTYYLNFNKGNSAFPSVVYESISFSSNNPQGVIVGTGTTPATVSDYRLQSQITSGLSGSLTVTRGVDEDNCPFIRHVVTLTNTSSNTITVGEVGYCQVVRCASTVGSTSSGGEYVLFDRTVLDNPIEIAAGDYETFSYTLKTSIPT